MTNQVTWPKTGQCSKGNYCEQGCAKCSRVTTDQQLVTIINHCIKHNKKVQQRFDEQGIWHNMHDAIAVCALVDDLPLTLPNVRWLLTNPICGM